MATNLALDPALLQRAFELSGLPTKKAAVSLALEEFIRRHEQRGLLELFGTVDGDPWSELADWRRDDALR